MAMTVNAQAPEQPAYGVVVQGRPTTSHYASEAHKDTEAPKFDLASYISNYKGMLLMLERRP
jgi:hypothetical protein